VISLDSLNVITTTQAATATHGIAYDSVHNRIWVTRKEVNQVVVLDGTTYAALATLPTGAEPHSVAYNPTNDRVYVSNFQGWSVTVYDAAAMSQERQLTDFAEPAHIAVNPRTNKIYVANHWAGNHVTVINGASHSTQRLSTSLIDAYGIAVDTGRNLIYATAIAQGRISIIDGATGTELGHVDIKRSNGKKVPLRVVAVNPGMGSQGHLWLVTSSEDGGQDQLLLIPNGWPTLGKPVPMPLDSYPLEGIAIQAGRNRIWVTSVSSGLVTVALDGEPACPSGFLAQTFDAGPFDGEVTAHP
jgi:DNA-binding beta-propeller fold protein YncE